MKALSSTRKDDLCFRVITVTQVNQRKNKQTTTKLKKNRTQAAPLFPYSPAYYKLSHYLSTEVREETLINHRRPKTAR